MKDAGADGFHMTHSSEKDTIDGFARIIRSVVGEFLKLRCFSKSKRFRVWGGPAVGLATKLRCLVGMSGILGLLLSAHAALAYIDQPVLVPSYPVENQLVSVSIAADFCDGFIEWEGYPQVTRNGNKVRLVVYAQHVDLIDFCVFPPHTITVPIGAFLSGAYSVQVDRFYVDDLKGPLTETLATIPFEVSGAVRAAALPSSSVASLAVLGLGLLLFAAAVLRWLVHEPT